jgi:autotransporter-associated beta strand protein
MRALFLATTTATTALLAATFGHAQDATWLTVPPSALGNFNTASNWTPNVVPGSITSTGTAFFGPSAVTSLTITAPTTLSGFTFNAGAPAYFFSLPGINSRLTFSGAGIINDSSNAPSFSLASGSFLNFTNSSTAGNAIITTAVASNLNFGGTSSAGTATITNNGGAIFFNNSSSAGSATISNLTGGLLDFFATSTAANATITNSASAAFFNTASGGQARFINNAGGTLSISGATAPVTFGSIEGAGTYQLGSNELITGLNNLSTTVSGVITGIGGSLVKTGSGTLTLSGLNTYTGPTTVNTGALFVDGSIASSSLTTVNSGATLGGSGTVGPTNILSGGTFAPGPSNGMPGTMTVTGSLAFQSGAIYLVTVTPTANSAVNVVGAPATATIGGGTVVANLPLGSDHVSYALLTAAGGRTGTFAGLTVNGDFDGTASLTYDPNHVFLTITGDELLATPPGAGVNQRNVVNSINNFILNSPANTELPPQFQILGSLSGPALLSGLTQLDGEVATGAERAAFQLTNSFLTLLADPIGCGGMNASALSAVSPYACERGRSALPFAPQEDANLPPDIALAYASIFKAPPKPTFEQHWSTWGSAYGGVNTSNGVATVGSNNVTTDIFGFAAGMDYSFTPDLLAGFALAGAGTNWGLANGLGTGGSDAFQVGARVISWFGPAYAEGALAFTNNWFTTNRSALGDQLTANFGGQSYGARIEGGYRYFVLPALGVTPYGAVQAQDFHTPAYSESDVTGGGLGLNYAAMNATDVRTELGMRFDDPTLLYGKPLILFGRLAWAHDFVTNPALNADFQALPGASFTVNGVPIPHDSALTTAGAELFFSANWSLLAKFEGEFGNGSQTYAGTGTLRYTW